MIENKNRATTINGLPQAQSRIENFLDFLCGRATDISALPKPQSRIEEFLEYLCHNQGVGGGGGLTQAQVQAMINGLIKDATFDESTKQLTLIKENNSAINIDLSSLCGGTTNTFNTDINFIPAIIQKVAEAPNGTPTSFCMDRYVRVEPFKIINKVGVQIRGFGNATIVPTNVKAYAINADNHEVIEILHDGTNDVSIETVNGVRYAVINVNKSYDVNVTFAFYVQRQGNYGSGSGIAINDTANKNLMYSNNQPSPGLRIAEWTSVNWSMGVYVEFVSRKVGEITKEVANKIGQYNSMDKEYQLFSVVRGDFDNSTNFRIPAVTITSNGNIVSATDIRYNTAHDQSKIDNGISLSKDGGKTWAQKIVMRGFGNDSRTRVMDSTILSSNSGRVFILCGSWTSGTANWEGATQIPDPTWSVRLATSTDNGETWTERVIAGHDFNNGNQIVTMPGSPQNMVSFLGGVGAGFQHSSGRLIFPVQVLRRDVNAGTNSVTATVIYSDNDGDTWTMASGFTPERVSENMVTEDNNGNLVLFGRANRNTRPMYISYDMGSTWQIHPTLHNKIDFASQCQGSLISIKTSSGYHVGLASGPSANGRRDYMLRLVDYTTGEVLNLSKFFTNRGNGYTCLAHGYIDNEPRLVVVYEAQGQIHYQDLSYILDRIDSIYANSECVKKWSDLEFVEETVDFTNLATNAEMRVGKFVSGENSNTDNDNNWKRIYIPVKNGKKYCILNKRGESKSGSSNLLGSSTFVLLGDDKTTHVSSQSVNSFNLFSRNGIEFTVNNPNAHYIGFNLYNVPNDPNWNNPTPFEELMVWDVEQTPDKPFIEGTTVKSVIIDGSKINTTFVSTTGLVSDTVSEALDELNKKIANSGTGTVTSVNGWTPDINGNVELLIITNDEIDEIINALK